MTATLQEARSDFIKLIDVVRQGEEVLIVDQGQAIARRSGVAWPGLAPNRQQWLATLARLRESTATGKTRPTTEEILEDLRDERG